MRTAKLLLLLVLAFIFSQCGTTEPGVSGSSASIREVGAILDTARATFLHFADLTSGNPWEAMKRTEWYLYEDPTVANVYLIDSSLMEIELKSGLTTSFRFIMTDDAGNAIYRGGGGSDATNADIPTNIAYRDPLPLAKNDIANRKVLFYASDTKSLPQVNIQLNKWTDLLSRSGLGLQVTTAKDEECTHQLIQTFKDYGLVIMDTHGLQDGFLLGTQITKAMLTGSEEAVKEAVNVFSPGLVDKIMSKEIKLGNEVSANPKTIGWQKEVKEQPTYKLFATSKLIRNLPEMPNTIIFGNMCYSGWMAENYTLPRRPIVYRNGDTAWVPSVTLKTQPIGKAFIDRNLISYYGYARDLPAAGTSRAVPDEFAGAMESSLLSRLVTNKDSTKIIHLDPTTKKEQFDPEHQEYELYGSLFLRQFGKVDYSYNKCVPDFTDARDGQKYKVVCIGNQVWMAENLRFNAPGSSNNSYGRFYDATATSNICPNGWHVPTVTEWTQLFDLFGGLDAAGGALKSKGTWDAPNTGATNSSGFTALPGGFYHAQAGYRGEYSEAYFSTSTLDATSRPQAITLHRSTKSVKIVTANPTDQVSCRCLKD